MERVGGGHAPGNAAADDCSPDGEAWPQASGALGELGDELVEPSRGETELGEIKSR